MSLSQCIAFAEEIHRGQTWKGTARPMIYHPLAVASLVLKYGGSMEQAMAAVLHDTISEPDVTQALLSENFGKRVADLAYSFEDPPLHAGAGTEWAAVKRNYLAKVEVLPEDALLIVVCEELHEIQELVTDLQDTGPITWKRYPVPDRDITWYYRKIAEIAYRRMKDHPLMVQDFSRLVRALAEHVHEGASLK